MIQHPKYKNSKVDCDGYTFDSKDEMHYYQYLKKLWVQGSVTAFDMQPKVVLIPAITLFDGTKQKEISYKPDFYVEYLGGYREMVDLKGFGTQQGILRRKLYNWLSVQKGSSVYNIPLRWIARNLKHGDANGFIDYDVLQKIRAKAKKDKIAQNQFKAV